MVKTNKKGRNFDLKKTRNQKGGGVSYEQSQLIQIRGKCDKFNEYSTGKPGSAGCECIVEGNSTGSFEFPTNMFECHSSKGLKIKPNSADPFYLRYSKFSGEAFNMSKEDFKFFVNDELQKLFDEVGGITTEALQFIVDYTLDPGKHESRIYKNGLNKRNLETLLDNLELIKSAVEKAKFNENIKFKDILNFLNELSNSITKQHEAMSKYYKKNKELIKKIEKPPAERIKEREERQKKEKDKKKKRQRRERKSKQKDNTNNNTNTNTNNNNKTSLDSQEEKKLKKLLRSYIKNIIKAPQQFYDDEDIIDLLFEELFAENSNLKLQERLKKKYWLEHHIVKLLFDFNDFEDETRDMVLKLDIKSIINLMQGYLSIFYNENKKYDRQVAKKYTEEFFFRNSISSPKEWFDSVKASLDEHNNTPKSKEDFWTKFAEIIYDLLKEE